MLTGPNTNRQPNRRVMFSDSAEENGMKGDVVVVNGPVN